MIFVTRKYTNLKPFTKGIRIQRRMQENTEKLYKKRF